MKLILAVFMVLAVDGRAVVWACSTIVLPPTTHELVDTAAFSGVVVGYVTGSSLLFTREPVPGLEIQIQESILGSKGRTVGHVFLLAYDTACQDIPYDTETLRTQYPVGVRVSVVGQVRGADLAGLEVISPVSSFGHVARILGQPKRTSRGTLDFGVMRDQYEEASSPSGILDREASWRNLHRGNFEDYEYLRALQLLSQVSPAEQTAIVENLMAYEGWRMYNGERAVEDFERLLEHYGVPEERHRAIVDRFKERQSDTR